ncbi:MAG: PAS domain S-box protein, partial [Acidobacteriota bacterium]
MHLERKINAAYDSSTERAQDALKEATDRVEKQARILDTALSFIPDFAYIFDREGRFIYVNRPLLNLWGLNLEDAIGKNFFDLQYPDELAAKLQLQIQQVIQTKQGLTDETPYTSPTGEGGYYEYIFRPVMGPAGMVEMVAGSTRDISERKRAEENLRRTQARLELALKAGLAGTFYWDIPANRVITDENMMRYFSLSEEAIVSGVPLDEVLRAIHHEDRSTVEQALTEAIETTGAYSIEYRVNHPDGKVRWLSARGMIERDDAGKASGLPGFTVDITERKSAEEAIRFQAHLLNTVEQAVIATDLKGTIIYSNRFAQDLYGWPAAEAIGRIVIEIAPSDRQQHRGGLEHGGG